MIQLPRQNNGVLDACKELGVKVLGYAPLGAGFLTGRFKSPEDFKQSGDKRGTGMFPRMDEENFEKNFALVKGQWRAVDTSRE